MSHKIVQQRGELVVAEEKVFVVGIREVHVSHRRVVATSPEAAIEKAGDAEELFCEYSHTLESDLWTVEQGKDWFEKESTK